MTANNDAALVREMAEDFERRAAILAEGVARLAAAAEKADELQAFYDERIDLWHCTMEDHKAAGEYLREVQAALLAAQQKLDLAHRAHFRAEATITRLRDALDEIADGTGPDRLGRYEPLRDWVHKVASRALAQDAEQLSPEEQALLDHAAEYTRKHGEFEGPYE